MKTPRIRPVNPQNGQAVEVFCRVKPLLDEIENCITVVDDQTIQTTSSANNRNGIHKEMLHSFTRVFDSVSDQPQVFKNVALPLIKELVDGKNGLLFNYGVTGSGKTYTMQGDAKDPGVLPRTMDVIFNSIEDVQTKKYVVRSDSQNGFDVQSETDAMMERQRIEILARQQTPRKERYENAPDLLVHENISVPRSYEKAVYAVFVSLVEVYNNYVFDLLQETPDFPLRTPQTRMLREDGRRNVYVSGCTEVEVKSAEEALKVFLTGQKRRRVGHTVLNAESSRSHSVFTIRLVRAPWDTRIDEVEQDKHSLTVSQLCLVDLAGSERTQRTGNHGDRLKEASNINTSLMGLRKCIEILRENQKNGGSTLVPYRDNRLTHLFKTFFEGEGRVRMLVCINQAMPEFDETMNVLKFAESTQEVQTFKAIPSTPRLRPPPTPSTASTLRRPISAISAAPAEFQLDEAIFLALDELEDSELLPTSLCLRGPNDDETLGRIGEFLETRMSRRGEAISALERAQQSFREQLVALLERNEALEEENRLLYANVETHQSKIQRLETHMGKFETELSEKNAALRQERAEKTRQVDHYRRLAQRVQHVGGDTPLSTPSTDLLDQPLESDDGTGASEVGTRTRGFRRPPVGPKPRMMPSSSDQNIVSTLSRQWENRASRLRAAATPTPTSKRGGALAMNPRHRRSKSAGELWLEHKDNSPVPSGTLMTPMMKKKKSVTKLEFKDATKATNYVLTHQSSDAEGNLETRLYKGDVIPTAGGGAAVIFNDVEELRQKSPGDRKRRSEVVDPETEPREVRLDDAAVEERCRMSVMGQPSKKRVKESKL